MRIPPSSFDNSLQTSTAVPGLRRNPLARYRITISGPSNEAMMDLVRKYRIQILDHGIQFNKEIGYLVDAIAETKKIQKLEDAGYHLERHENVDEVGEARQKEVGKGNRYKQPSGSYRTPTEES